MNDLVGKLGVVTADLRPFGEIQVDQMRCEARSEAGWVDAGSSVVVLKRGERDCWIVKPAASDGILSAVATATAGDAKTSGIGTERSAEGPPFWLERAPLRAVGTGLGLSLVPVALLSESWHWNLLLLPLNGWVWGAIVLYSVRAISDLLGPYTDHRPASYFCLTCGAISAGFGAVGAMVAGWGLVGMALAVTVGLVFGMVVSAVYLQ